MKIKKFDQSLNTNLELAPLTALKGEPKSWREMPNKAFQGTSYEVISKFFTLLTGEPINPDDVFYLISFNEAGSFRKFFGPSLYRDGESLIIRWGSNLIPLNLGENGISSDVTPELKFSFTSSEVGKFSEPTLKINFMSKEEDTLYTINFAIQVADWENRPDAQTLDGLLSFGQHEELLGHLAQFTPKQPSEQVNSLSSIPENTPVIFLDFSEVTRKKDGTKTFILMNEEGRFWATGALVNLINAGAKTPVVVTRTVNKKGKNSYSYEVTWEETDIKLDLSWV